MCANWHVDFSQILFVPLLPILNLSKYFMQISLHFFFTQFFPEFKRASIFHVNGFFAKLALFSIHLFFGPNYTLRRRTLTRAPRPTNRNDFTQKILSINLSASRTSLLRPICNETALQFFYINVKKLYSICK